MDSLWPSLAAELKKELPAQQYDTWIKPLRAERQEDQLVLVAPNHHVLRWVRSNLLSKIETRVERLAAGRLSVNLVLDEKPADAEIIAKLPEIKYASIWGQIQNKTEYGGEHTNTGVIMGADQGYPEIYGGELSDGRWFTNSELVSGAPVIVLSVDVAKKLFGNIQPLVQYGRSNNAVCNLGKTE